MKKRALLVPLLISACALFVGAISLTSVQNMNDVHAAANPLAYKCIDLTKHEGRGKSGGYTSTEIAGVNPAQENSITGEFYGGNTYNGNWNYVKFGRVVAGAASIENNTIESTVAIDQKINKIGLNVYEHCATSNGVLKTVNLYVADATTKIWSPTAIASANVDSSVASEVMIDVPAANQSLNQLYRLELTFEVISSAKKNGLVSVDYVNFYVPASGSVESLSINESEITSIYVGGKQQYTASITVSGNLVDSVTWSLENVEPIGAATIDSAGLLSAHARGSATLKVVADADNSKFVTLPLTIVANPYISLSYEGVPVEQKANLPFNPEGLSFTGVREHGGISNIVPVSEIIFSPTLLSEGVGQTVSATIKGTSVSCDINGLTVVGVTYNLYEAVNTFDELVDQADYLMVGYGEDANASFVATTNFAKQIGTTMVGYNGELLVLDNALANVKLFKASKSTDTFTLFDGTNYLCIQSSKTDLIASSTLVDELGKTTSLIFDTNGMIASSEGGVTRSLLLNNDSKVIKNYASSNFGKSSYSNVKLFKLVQNASTVLGDLDLWAKKYMHIDDSTFNNEGTGKCISDGLYKSAKAVLNGMNINRGNTISTLMSDASLNAAKLRFEAWARANGDANPYDGKAFEAKPSSLFLNLGDKTAQSSLIIVVITVVSLSSVSLLAIFYTRKKRLKK